MTWIGPALLFFGCSGVALVISFGYFVAACDRLAARLWQNHQEDQR